MLFGIDVVVIAPGAVKTPIWSKAEEVDISVYKNSPYLPGAGENPRLHAHPGRDRAAGRDGLPMVFEALTLSNPKVRYTLVPDPMQRWMAAVLPERTFDKLIAKRLGLMPQG